MCWHPMISTLFFSFFCLNLEQMFGLHIWGESILDDLLGNPKENYVNRFNFSVVKWITSQCWVFGVVDITLHAAASVDLRVKFNGNLATVCCVTSSWSWFRYSDVFLKRCFKPSLVVMPQCRRLASANLDTKLALSITKAKQKPCKELKFSSSRGTKIFQL